MVKVCVGCSRFWECENMDFDAPITREGFSFLFDDGTIQNVYDDEKLSFDIRMATEEEKLNYAHKIGFARVGDKVEIVSGRKLPIGAIKEIKSFSTYYVPNTFKKVSTEYVHFTDGTKTSVHNVRVVGFDKSEFGLRQYTDNCLTLRLGGRVW